MMSFENIHALDILVGALLLLLLWTYTRRNPKNQLPPPPGPKPLPILGNLLDMPKHKDWLTFADWGHKYGPVTSVKVFDKTIVLLNTHKSALDLLDKRSSIYSSRPVLHMAGELCGWEGTLALQPYGARWKRMRTMVKHFMGTRSSLSNILPLTEAQTVDFLRLVLDKPSDLVQHLRTTAGSIILQVAYGYKVNPNRDPLVDLAERALDQFSKASEPGQFLVDLMPVLRHIPNWVPGTSWKKTASAWYQTLHELVDRPYQYVQDQMSAGIATPSFTLQQLEELKSVTAEDEEIIKFAAASLYSGGADSTVCALETFHLCMLLFPEVQAKAQAEIDRVVGPDRLPTFEDRPNLPYIDAIVRETLRFHPVAPLSLPHRLEQDDIYDGHRIPKGALVIGNIWQMLHDPNVYKAPEVFRPERFLGPTPEPDPRTTFFGFGRRVCPGQVLADAQVFISIALTLAVFNLRQPVDEKGRIVEPSGDYMSGTISHPVPFAENITPRSAKAEALVREVCSC